MIINKLIAFVIVVGGLLCLTWAVLRFFCWLNSVFTV